MKKLLGISAAVLGLVAFTGAAQAQTIAYEDTFSANGPTGFIEGSTPDTVDTNGAVWATNFTGDFASVGGVETLNPNGYAYTSASLPVNGTSGVSLAGGFTLSVGVTSGSSGLAGISLYTGPSSGYGAEGNAGFNLGGPFSLYSNGFAGGENYYFGLSGATTLEIVYNAAAGTLSYEQNGAVIQGYSGPAVYSVTAAEIASITGVGIANQGFPAYGDTTLTSPTYSNFELVVPEPSTVWLFVLGFAGLVFQIQRKRLSKV